jgi:hypothetical protein
MLESFGAPFLWYRICWQRNQGFPTILSALV